LFGQKTRLFSEPHNHIFRADEKTLAETKTEADFATTEAELHVFQTRWTAPADLTAEHMQPRVDFHMPQASPNSEAAKSPELLMCLVI